MSHVIPSTKRDVVVIGAGIAGLAAARWLVQHRPEIKLTVIEQDTRLGGKILTERVDGFVIEGGPDTFLAYKPRGVGLCRELGLEGRLEGTNPDRRRTFILREGKLFDLPEGLTGLIPSHFGPMIRTRLISPLGKMRMALEPFIPPKAPGSDESLASFVRRRLGREAYDRMVEPLMGGIYAGDGNRLSLAATFPQLRETELRHGSLTRGMLHARRHKGNGHQQAPRRPASAFLTPRTGLAEIIEALEQRLAGADVRKRTTAVRVEPLPGEGYHVRLAGQDWIETSSVILATPAFVSAQLVEGFDPQMGAELGSIPYTSTATVSLAFPLSAFPRALDGYGYIVPQAEGRPILACTWTSTKFPHRAPDGFALIRAFIGKAGKEDLLDADDQALVLMVRTELDQVMGVRTTPILQRVFRWPQAMPQYTLGHPDRLARLERRLDAHPGLQLAGSAYRGIGLPDCIASGEAAAAAALSHVQSMEKERRR